MYLLRKIWTNCTLLGYIFISYFNEKANIYLIYLMTAVNSFLVDYMLNQNQGHALIILLTESQIKPNKACFVGNKAECWLHIYNFHVW